MEQQQPAPRSDEAPIPYEVDSEHLEKLLQLQRDILRMVVLDEDSDDAVLDELCLLSEAMVPNSVASIMLYDPGRTHLLVRAAPSIPPAGINALNGLEPGPNAGSCGTAVYTEQPVFVENTRCDPRWERFSDFADTFNLRACWSMPIRNPEQGVIGSFALTSFEARPPSAFHRRLLDTGSYLAGIVLQRQTQKRRLLMAGTAFEHMSEGIMLTDAEHRIVETNDAFTQITGYEPGEVRGRNPSMLSSGRHDGHFYQTFWRALDSNGHWEGEIWNRRKNGEHYPEWLSVKAVRDTNDELISYVAVFADISSIKSSEQKLWRLAHHDALTGLPNRLLLNIRLDHALTHARRENSSLAVIFLDLDRFKNINDSLGHQAGDSLLRQMARRLLDCLRAEDTVARLGGDEFVILLENLHDPMQTQRAAEKILATCRKPVEIDDQSFVITPSLGVSLFPQDGDDAEALLQNADTAMYQAKAEGRNRIAYYAPELTRSVQARVTLESELRQALELKQFELHYQPLYHARSGRLTGAEALVRWRHPRNGLTGPDTFIPLAEEIGLIHELGYWVTRTACDQARQWLEAGLPALDLAINLSPSQLHGDCANCLGDLVREAGFPAERLEFEITESMIMEHGSEAIRQLAAMQQQGLRLTMDDFGTGHSSMSQLKRLPISKLKIDRSFVAGIPDDPNDSAIVRAIIALGRALGLPVTAEGVETLQQETFLRREGCDYFQGFRYSRPLDAEQFGELLAGQH